MNTLYICVHTVLKLAAWMVSIFTWVIYSCNYCYFIHLNMKFPYCTFTKHRLTFIHKLRWRNTTPIKKLMLNNVKKWKRMCRSWPLQEYVCNLWKDNLCTVKCRHPNKCICNQLKAMRSNKKLITNPTALTLVKFLYFLNFLSLINFEMRFHITKCFFNIRLIIKQQPFLC